MVMERAKTDRLADPHKYSSPEPKAQKKQQRRTHRQGSGFCREKLRNKPALSFFLYRVCEAIKDSLPYLRYPNTYCTEKHQVWKRRPKLNAIEIVGSGTIPVGNRVGLLWLNLDTDISLITCLVIFRLRSVWKGFIVS
ncbi:hypothetical protein NPIL_582591 [Nephila pilipes]|uniref:Uncharacterized protein n=1 Tax=Nephila pilipes TaxID=299642 RepID=A0A8X6MZY8_NEPPI|nr:hypothetical protein NPIL_582591 [Nephila pilipes]